MTQPKVMVIDYGVGNLLSVCRSLEYCGAKVATSSVKSEILESSHVILPGVGAFASAMSALARLGLVDVIETLASKQTPLLGICLGMQLLLDESDEFGTTKGLGLIPGRVIPIPNCTISGSKHKIPHIGWNELRPTLAGTSWKNTLIENNNPSDAAYFVHSFMAETKNPSHCIANVSYGGHSLAAVINRGAITGCQFHPEKSGEVGMKILKKFISE